MYVVQILFEHTIPENEDHFVWRYSHSPKLGYVRCYDLELRAKFHTLSDTLEAIWGKIPSCRPISGTCN